MKIPRETILVQIQEFPDDEDTHAPVANIYKTKYGGRDLFSHILTTSDKEYYLIYYEVEREIKFTIELLFVLDLDVKLN